MKGRLRGLFFLKAAILLFTFDNSLHDGKRRETFKGDGGFCTFPSNFRKIKKGRLPSHANQCHREDLGEG